MTFIALTIFNINYLSYADNSDRHANARCNSTCMVGATTKTSRYF